MPAAPPKAVGTGPDRRPAGGAGVDRASGAGAPRAEPPALAGPAHRAADTPLRAPPSRRSGPFGRQKGGQSTARGRVEGPRQSQHRSPRDQAPPPRRLQLPPRLHRRPQPPRLCRGPRQRDRRHALRVLRARPRLVPLHRDSRRRDHHRQRGELPVHQVRRPARPPRHRPHLHQALPAPDQRQSRAIQPHPPDEFLYSYKFKSEPDRRRRLQTWIHHYNLHRHHTAIDGTPSSRVHNLYGHYT